MLLEYPGTIERIGPTVDEPGKDRIIYITSDEQLEEPDPVHGITGYDFCAPARSLRRIEEEQVAWLRHGPEHMFRAALFEKKIKDGKKSKIDYQQIIQDMKNYCWEVSNKWFIFPNPEKHQKWC